MNPSEVYLQHRASRFQHNKAVDPAFLRAHVDFVRSVQKFGSGLHPVVITVTRTATAEVLSLVPAINRPEVVVRLESQRFDGNVV